MRLVPEVSTTIDRPIEVVFALITDFQSYPRWLGGSALYTGTSEVSENPVVMGTRYTDRGKMSVMRGSVTTYAPPQRITFTQTQSLPVGTLEIAIQYRLEALSGTQTKVSRTVEVRGTGIVRLIEPLFPSMLRPEEIRVLGAMKTYLEGKN